MLGFFNDEPDKKPASHRIAGPRSGAKGGHVPIHTMREMGCRACPSDRDRELKSPKMEAQGKASPKVYVLLGHPSKKEDIHGEYLADRAGDALHDVLTDLRVANKVRVHATVRCHQPGLKPLQKPEVAPTECCRGYVVKDIEDAAPTVIIGIGDAALQWATGISKNPAMHRGTMFAVKIGRHVCWYMQVLYPMFVFKDRVRATDEYVLAFRHDIRKAVEFADTNPAPPVVYDRDFDKGIEIITGQEGGDMARLEEALHTAIKLPYSGLDYETSGLRPFMQQSPQIWTAAIGTFDHTVAFPVAHPEGWGTDARVRRVYGLLGDYLMQAGRKICHHVGFEMEWTNYFYGDRPLRLTEWEDTMALAHTLDERKGTKSLGVVTNICFGFDVKSKSNVDAARLLDYPLEEVLRYNGMDTKWEDAVFYHLRPIVQQREADWREYERKVRLAPTLVLTQAKGVPVDTDYAKQLDVDMLKQSNELARQIVRTPEVVQFERRHGTFRVGNTDDDLKLMQMLKRPEIQVEEREGTRLSTDKSVLSVMPPDEVPSAQLILDHREIEKLRGTYVIPCIEGKYTCTDGRMRSTYSSMVAITGRLNSEDPNLQNFPKRKYKHVRGIVYAPRGQWIAALDYGQIEARVFAMASEDDALMRALWTGYDIHGFWADWFLKESPDWADYLARAFKVERGDAKAIRKTARDHVKNRWVFPQFFGAAVFSCAGNMHLDVDVAEKGAAQFWDEFRGVKKWQEKLMRDYERNLYVETLTGRRERGPLTKNQILNQPIQGTAADIVTDSMNVLSEQAFIEDDPELQPNLNVHDDLTSLLADNGMEQKIEKIARVMCKPRFDFINVPLIVEAQIGERWHKLEDYHVFRSNELFEQPNPFAKETA